MTMATACRARAGCRPTCWPSASCPGAATPCRSSARWNPRRTLPLLDEVDSFLMDRRQAEHSWEHTQVNELLQQMERYPGIFIAATNLMGGLDPAARRRFDFKLHFRALTPDQRRGLFAREALGDEQAPLPPAWERYLAALPGLMPGDFATVCRQRELLGQETPPEQFLRRLATACCLIR